MAKRNLCCHCTEFDKLPNAMRHLAASWRTVPEEECEKCQEGGGSDKKEADVNDSAVTALNEISPEILRGVKLWVKNGRTPHDIGHAVAHNYPDMGTAFYRIVERAAEEMYKELDHV